jgi:hypothetical protein
MDFRLSARCADIYVPLGNAVDIVRIYHIAQPDALITHRPSLAYRMPSTVGSHSSRPLGAPMSTQPRKAFSQDAYLIDTRGDGLRPSAALFQRHAHLAIPSREGELGGHWRRDSKKQTCAQASRRVVASSAYSSSNACCLTVPGISPICGRVGNVVSTRSRRIVADLIASIVISTALYASSETSSNTAARSLCRPRAHRNCDAFGHSCHGTVGAHSRSAPLHRRETGHERPASAPEPKGVLRGTQHRRRSASLGADPSCHSGMPGTGCAYPRNTSVPR